MTIETQADVEALKTIGKIVAETLKLMMSEAKAGMTTKELDEIGRSFLELHHAKSAPKYCYNFPGTTCISIGNPSVSFPKSSRDDSVTKFKTNFYKLAYV